MKNVFVASSLVDASLVVNLLKAYGIESHAVEKLRGNIGTRYSEVWVLNDSDGDRAVELINQLNANSEGDPWKCTDCGEENPPTFGICWNCAVVRSQDSA